MLLTRDDILASPLSLPVERVPVPEWQPDGEVLVKTMTGAERDAFEQEVVAAGDRLDNIRARIAAHTCVDEQGKRLFSPDDIQALGRTSCVALDRVFDAARRLNKLSKQDVEELEKNSARDPSAASS